MNENYYETEVKIYLADPQQFLENLTRIGAEKVNDRVFERNFRFDRNNRSLKKKGMVLRLRQDDRIRLTYKESGQYTEGIAQRFEAEVEVGDWDNMLLILYKLGYHPYMSYEKYRTTFTYHNCEIVLDELPYGDFCEVEGSVEEIEFCLQKLGLENSPRLTSNYSGLFERVKKELGLNLKDLTFENFKGITVPSYLFTYSS
ncbi:hypothetical protein MASR2M15_21060 [Anaerolineales bacterium]